MIYTPLFSLKKPSYCSAASPHSVASNPWTLGCLLAIVFHSIIPTIHSVFHQYLPTPLHFWYLLICCPLPTGSTLLWLHPHSDWNINWNRSANHCPKMFSTYPKPTLPNHFSHQLMTFPKFINLFPKFPLSIYLASVKRLLDYGKIHHFEWVNPLFRLGRFQVCNLLTSPGWVPPKKSPSTTMKPPFSQHFPMVFPWFPRGYPIKSH